MPEFYKIILIFRLESRIRNEPNLDFRFSNNDDNIEYAKYKGGGCFSKDKMILEVCSQNYIDEFKPFRKSSNEILFTLAHEYGHYLSFINNEDTEDVLHNEEIAWNKAKDILMEMFVFNIDSCIFAEFNTNREMSLDTYKE
jgi:Zn-dependent peptidase ImmA (M78 family)